MRSSFMVELLDPAMVCHDRRRRRPDICIIDDRNRLDYDLGDLDQVIDRYIATGPST